METKTVEYELRELHSKDVFSMLNIIKKIGIKEFKECFDSDEVKEIKKGDKVDMEAIGLAVFMDMSSIIISNVSSCEKEVYKFLSSLSGIKESDMAELPMNTFIKMIIDVFKKEEFKDFIVVVSELLK